MNQKFKFKVNAPSFHKLLLLAVIVLLAVYAYIIVVSFCGVLGDTATLTHTLHGASVSINMSIALLSGP